MSISILKGELNGFNCRFIAIKNKIDKLKIEIDENFEELHRLVKEDVVSLPKVIETNNKIKEIKQQIHNYKIENQVLQQQINKKRLEICIQENKQSQKEQICKILLLKRN